MNKVIIFLFCILLLSNCKKENILELKIVATPEISPDDTIHSVSVDVDIYCGTYGATVYYTLDGSNPTINSTVYKTPFTIRSATTVKAFAAKEGMEASHIAIKTYTINASMEWQQLYGGSDYDEFNSIQQTNDGGYIVAGNSTSTDILGVTNHGMSDCYVIKINSGGEIEWQKMYGGSRDDYANSIIQTSDGGYIITGQSVSTDIPLTTNNDSEDCYIIKINSSGDIEWQRMLGSNGDDGDASLIQASDGGYFIAVFISEYMGVSLDYIAIIKLDSNGFIKSQKDFYLNNCFDDKEYIRVVKLTNDGGCVVGGSLVESGRSYYATPWDIFLVKLGSDAEKDWQQIYEGDYPFAGGINSIEETSDGIYVIAGRSGTDISTYDGYLIKINSSSSKTFQKNYGGSDGDMLNSISKTVEGDYVIAGYSISEDLDNLINFGSSDGYIIKTYSTGFVKWQKLCGGNDWDEFNSIQQTNDGGYYIAAGISASTDIPGAYNHGLYDGYIVKISSDK